MNWLLQASCASMPALPDPVTSLPRNELLVIEIGTNETPLDSRMPYRAALCRLFRSKSLPVRSVAAIAFAPGPADGVVGDHNVGTVSYADGAKVRRRRGRRGDEGGSHHAVTVLP